MSETLLPFSNNRLLIVDWASLSYHQMFALVSKHNTTSSFDLDSPESELYAWKTNMVDKFLGIIRKFNPKDIIIALEGNEPWRIEYCKKYYEENTKVCYDENGYYVRFDNLLYKFFKDGDGQIEFKKMDIVKDAGLMSKKEKKLTELPEKIQTLFWDTVLPKYKGNREKQGYWPFFVKKDDWKKFKDEFAAGLTGIFRTHAIKLEEAEADDTIYVSTEYWGSKYDSIVIVTCDSDMTQLITDKVKIYNHKTGTLVECDDPKTFLELKVLAGDDSDNINGIALPGKKLQLGPVNAAKLYESVSNCFQKAKDEGWDNQYMRNKKLIDLSNAPTHVQRKICELLDASNPEMEDISKLYQLNITEKIEKELLVMKTSGFYALSSNKRIEDNPDLFKKELAEISEKKPAPPTFKPKRTFEDISSAVVDPLSNGTSLSLL